MLRRTEGEERKKNCLGKSAHAPKKRKNRQKKSTADNLAFFLSLPHCKERGGEVEKREGNYHGLIFLPFALQKPRK